MALFERALVARSYSISLTIPQYKAVEASDEKRSDQGTQLWKQLELPGVDMIDYNGHYGPNIFLRIEPEHDTPETWSRIEGFIALTIQDGEVT